ncbi:hypothetical protein Aduo_019600 [Ancylostoma duodenale]
MSSKDDGATGSVDNQGVIVEIGDVPGSPTEKAPLLSLNPIDDVQEVPTSGWLFKFMSDVEYSGKSSIPWVQVQPALLSYFENIIHKEVHTYVMDVAKSKKKIQEVDLEHCYQEVYKKLENFVDFPSTFRRICSIITRPRRSYSHVPDLIEALLEVVNVEPIICSMHPVKRESMKGKGDGDEDKDFYFFDDSEIRYRRASKTKLAIDAVERGPGSKHLKIDDGSEESTLKNEEASENVADSAEAEIPLVDLTEDSTSSDSASLELPYDWMLAPQNVDGAAKEITNADSEPEVIVISEKSSSTKQSVYYYSDEASDTGSEELGEPNSAEAVFTDVAIPDVTKINYQLPDPEITESKPEMSLMSEVGVEHVNNPKQSVYCHGEPSNDSQIEHHKEAQAGEAPVSDNGIPGGNSTNDVEPISEMHYQAETKGGKPAMSDIGTQDGADVEWVDFWVFFWICLLLHASPCCMLQ